MALTNALLKSMGIDGDQRDQIMTEHQNTLEAIKTERDNLRDTAARVPELERQIQEYQSKSTEDWEKKYNDEHTAFEQYKSQVSLEKSEKEKSDLFRTLLLEQGIDPKRVDSIMRVTNLQDVTVKDGKLDKHDELAKSVAEEWKDFVIKTQTKGAQIDTPPGGDGHGKTRDEILAIKDTSERQNAIAENPELFGLA